VMTVEMVHICHVLVFCLARSCAQNEDRSTNKVADAPDWAGIMKPSAWDPMTVEPGKWVHQGIYFLLSLMIGTTVRGLHK
jgi:hypothetical protein